MSYFVTGATGFIGRRLIERLLETRQGDIYVLVRGGSRERLEDLIERWSVVCGPAAAKRVPPVIGDLRRPLLGVEQERVEELRGKITHFFHLAAVYDMTAPSELNTAVNVGGTTHAVELTRAVEAERLHHVSSIAVAGEYKGVFEEFNKCIAAAHAPRVAVSTDKRLTDLVPQWPVSLALRLPPQRQVRRVALRELDIPEDVLPHIELVHVFDTSETQQALKRSA